MSEAVRRWKNEIRDNVIDSFDFAVEIKEAELMERIEEMILRVAKTQYISVSDRSLLKKAVFSAIRGFDILEDLLEERDISEIMVNGFQTVFVEREGKLYRTKQQFESKERFEDLIQRMAAGANRIVNEANPITDTRLPDGSRVNIVLPPVALDGPIVTIRKFSRETFDMEKLIQCGSLTGEAAGFLKQLVCSGYNIFISGGTGSGKTTFLNALSGVIPPEERVITIEDSAELQLQNLPNLVRLEARNQTASGCTAVTIRDLIRCALRMRPDRIVVGEVRGAEAIDMIQAMNTGHDGSLSTGHANSPEDMLNRLETMILLDSEIPLTAIRKQMASALDVMIHLGRTRDGKRKVFEITEVCGYQNGEIVLNSLFTLSQSGDTGEDTLKRTQSPMRNTQKLIRKGVVPDEIFSLKNNASAPCYSLAVL